MTYCASCGAELDDGVAFCSSCGEPVEDSDDTEPSSDASPTEETETESVADAETETESVADAETEADRIQWKRVGMAGALALIPAFIAYMALSLATGGDPVGIVFVLALPVFGYLLYQRPTAKAMAGGMSYYLAIEFLLSPFVFLLYTIAFANENTATTAGQAGAAIGGFALTIGAFIIGLPLAIALYLVSNRLDPAD